MISRYFWQTKPRRYRERPDDPQAHKVYTMERAIIGSCIGAHVDEDDLQAIANHACRKWRVAKVEVVVKGMGTALFGECDHEIRLNKDWHGDNVPVLVHELAHWIASEIWGDDNIEAHGPEWAQVYRVLLNDYKVLPYECSAVLFDKYEVRYEEDIKPPRKVEVAATEE